MSKRPHAKLLILHAIGEEVKAAGITENNLLLIAPRMLRKRLNDRLKTLGFKPSETINERSLSRFLSGK